MVKTVIITKLITSAGSFDTEYKLNELIKKIDEAKKTEDKMLFINLPTHEQLYHGEQHINSGSMFIDLNVTKIYGYSEHILKESRADMVEKANVIKKQREEDKKNKNKE